MTRRGLEGGVCQLRLRSLRSHELAAAAAAARLFLLLHDEKCLSRSTTLLAVSHLSRLLQKELVEGYSLATEEAAAAFGDSRMLIEKYIEQPRHIEIQAGGGKGGQGQAEGKRRAANAATGGGSSRPRLQPLPIRCCACICRTGAG